MGWTMLALRRLRDDRAATAGLVALVLVTALLAALAPRVLAGLADEAVEAEIGTAPAAARNLALYQHRVIDEGPADDPLAPVRAAGLAHEETFPQAVRRLIDGRSAVVESGRFRLTKQTTDPAFVRFRIQEGVDPYLRYVSREAAHRDRRQPGRRGPGGDRRRPRLRGGHLGGNRRPVRPLAGRDGRAHRGSRRSPHRADAPGRVRLRRAHRDLRGPRSGRRLLAGRPAADPPRHPRPVVRGPAARRRAAACRRGAWPAGRCHVHDDAPAPLHLALVPRGGSDHRADPRRHDPRVPPSAGAVPDRERDGRRQHRAADRDAADPRAAPGPLDGSGVDRRGHGARAGAGGGCHARPDRDPCLEAPALDDGARPEPRGDRPPGHVAGARRGHPHRGTGGGRRGAPGRRARSHGTPVRDARGRRGGDGRRGRRRPRHRRVGRANAGPGPAARRADRQPMPATGGWSWRAWSSPSRWPPRTCCGSVALRRSPRPGRPASIRSSRPCPRWSGSPPASS